MQPVAQAQPGIPLRDKPSLECEMIEECPRRMMPVKWPCQPTTTVIPVASQPTRQLQLGSLYQGTLLRFRPTKDHRRRRSDLRCPHT